MGKVSRFKRKKKKKTRPAPSVQHSSRVVWQIRAVRMPTWVNGEDGRAPYRPLAALALSLEKDLISASELMEPENFVPADAVVEALEKLHDLCGNWPDTIETTDQELAGIIKAEPAVPAATITVRDRLAGIDSVLDQMVDGLHPGQENRHPDPTKVPGFSTDLLRSFAVAAERFFMAEPWSELENEDIIRIDSAVPDNNLRHIVVMGAGGEEFGLIFMAEADDLACMGDVVADDLLRDKALWSLSAYEAPELHFREHDLWEDENLPTVMGGLIPAAFCFGPKRRIRRPSPKIMRFLEGVLLALAETTVEELDSTRWRRTVDTSSGPMPFEFTLIDFGDGFDDHGDEPFAGLPPRHHLEQMSFGFRDNPTTENEDRAQDLAFEAMETMGRRRFALARQALELDSNCVDALAILAQSERDPQAGIAALRRAVDAGRKKLGERFFEDNAGHFWGLVETRPFMRAMFDLALSLWSAGARDEGLDVFREMLQLNPGDNQGVRMVFGPALIVADEIEEAAELLSRVDESRSAWWCYTRALVTFAQEGDSDLATQRLLAAFEVNPHLPPLLTGESHLPPVVPEYIKFGDVSEAESIIFEQLPAWESCEGALSWLHEHWEVYDAEHV